MNRTGTAKLLKGFRPGVVTRALSHVAPLYAERRVQAELRSHIRQTMFSEGGYDAARDSRMRDGWNPPNSSPDGSTLLDIEKIRARSADLLRNNPFANSIIQTYVTNIVSTGIQHQPTIDFKRVGMEESVVRKINQDAGHVFSSWAEAPDYSGRLNWHEAQQLFVRQVLEMGDMFVIPRMASNRKRRLSSPLQTRIQLIEADRVRSPSFGRRNTEEDIRDGVAIDRVTGEPLAVYVANTYKTDHVPSFAVSRNREFDRVDWYDNRGNWNVLHLMESTRPGLSRGVPFLAPSMLLFDDLSSYLEAELTAARVAACFSVFIKKLDPLGAASGNLWSGNTTSERLESIEPGMIEYLDVNEDIASFSPQRPSATFEGFVSRLLKTISSAAGLPYELVAKDFSGVNYSSARIALLQSYRRFRAFQRWLACKALQPIYERVMEEAYLRGLWGEEIPLSAFNSMRREFLRCHWISPGWEWVDPLKEAQAQVMAVNSNITTLSDLVTSMGNDWEDVLEQRAREKATEKRLGLIEEQEDVSSERPRSENE